MSWYDSPCTGTDALLEHFQKEGYEKEEFLDMKMWKTYSDYGKRMVVWNNTVMKLLEHLYD